MNANIEHKNWLKKNWKWLTSLLAIIIMFFVVIFNSEIGDNISDITKAYADPDLIDGAFKKAQENDEVLELLGTLQPIDNMAIFEGAVKYSNDDSSIDISFRVKGTKGRGRMRIIADRKLETWDYKEVIVGIKKLQKTIIIIEKKDD